MLKWLFKTKHERDIKKLQPLVDRINACEADIKKLKDEEFKEKTAFFKKEIAAGKNIENILPEAFALVREASVRTLGERHYDVQLMGGIVLCRGIIAEMKTGEGKTLASTLPAYLRALEGKGVHIVTVNDYLAKRDAEWMAPVYELLGVTVDCIEKHRPHSPERRAAYQADITYGTNNEFGFDYLRDNMVEHISQKVQRAPYYCIIDEVDSILIDEARTPLIISGPSDSNVEKYYEIDKIIPRLKQAKTDESGKEIPGTGDFTLDEKDKNIVLTEDGVHKIEKLLKVDNLYSQNNVDVLHHVNQALRAHKIMQNDRDYIVENNSVVIIDEFTGRKMEGRRFSDGLHQAIEAKERVNVRLENQTLASITFQNYFKMYQVLAGMTGTADTEAEEFSKIYKLDVVVIPTNLPCIREDYSDRVYRTMNEKFNAIVDFVKERYKQGQPVLIGTASVEMSETLDKLLSRAALPHEVLNAKNHEREAHIIEKAGHQGAITIATNMAGRGTDIKLGPGVKGKGGLCIVGSERHEARRVDNQLRGRAGRQGDKGMSVFFLSLEDDLMRRFGSERMSGLMKRLGLKDGQEIQHRWINRAIENAQKKVEGRNFEIRKHLLEYDDVMNSQRQFIYTERNFYLSSQNMEEKIMDMIDDVVTEQLSSFADGSRKLNEDVYTQIEKWFSGAFAVSLPFDLQEFLNAGYEKNEDKLVMRLQSAYKEKRSNYPPEAVSSVERSILLNTLDSRWKEHLLNMDHLREGIQLRSYAQTKPLTEFKHEGYRLFQEMLASFKNEVVEILFHVRDIRTQEIRSNVMSTPVEAKHEQFQAAAAGAQEQGSSRQPNQLRSRKDVGRNDPCPCGSGKKYKKCCGR